MFSLFTSFLFSGGIGTKITMLLLAILLVLSVGSCTYKEAELLSATHQVTSLQKDIGTLNANNSILKQNQDTLKQSNEANVATINKLVEERKDAQVAINTLAKQKQVEHAKVITAQRKIDEMLKDPKNNGPIAPVLSETLKEYNK